LEEENYSLLKDVALSCGISLFGVCRIDSFKEKIMGISPEVIESLPFAISLAFRLSDKVIEDIKDHPTQLYLHHYRQVNYLGKIRKGIFLTNWLLKRQDLDG